MKTRGSGQCILGAIALAAVASCAVPARAAGVLEAASLGVVCDGATDATQALQAAMRRAAQQGAALALPQGACVATKLVWPRGLTGLSGQGVDATVVRRAANSDSAVLLAIENAGGFTVSNLTLDGNRTNNPHPNHDVILNQDWDFTFDHVRAQGAKGAGKGYGFGFYQVADANRAHGTASRFLGCDASGNDVGGLGGQEGFGITIRGGRFADNGVNGIDWYKAWKADTLWLEGLTVSGVTASGNGSTGIRVSYWGFGPTDTMPSTSARDVHIDGNTVTGNHMDGIVYQATAGTVSGNRITGNGTKAGDGTALLFNAVDSQAVGNTVQSNPGFFGIDAGGTVRSVIKNNTITDNGRVGRGNGLNVGGSFGDLVTGNTVSNNGRVQIGFGRQEASDHYFPWDSGSAQIRANQISTASPQQVGLEIVGGPSGVDVLDNRFSGPDPWKLLVDTGLNGRIAGNGLVNGPSPFPVTGADTTVFPDWADSIVVANSARIRFIEPATAAAYAGSVLDVVMRSRGNGFHTAPAITITGGGCSGVEGTAKLSMDGRLAQVLITNPGNGCLRPPTVAIRGRDGSAAAAEVGHIGIPLPPMRRVSIQAKAEIELLAGGNILLQSGSMRMKPGSTILLQNERGSWIPRP